MHHTVATTPQMLDELQQRKDHASGKCHCNPSLQSLVPVHACSLPTSVFVTVFLPPLRIAIDLPVFRYP